MKSPNQIVRKIRKLHSAMQELGPEDTAYVEAMNRKEALLWALGDDAEVDEDGNVVLGGDRDRDELEGGGEYPSIKDLDRRKY